MKSVKIGLLLFPDLMEGLLGVLVTQQKLSHLVHHLTVLPFNPLADAWDKSRGPSALLPVLPAGLLLSKSKLTFSRDDGHAISFKSSAIEGLAFMF